MNANNILKDKDYYSVDDLLNVVKILRSPMGCPWDSDQTHLTLRRDFLEECYEAIEAIDNKDAVLLREELGDVLFHIIFHSSIEEERNSFNFYDVVNDITKKMILRHPHVFSDVSVSSTDEVLENWDAIKMKTKGQKSQKDVLRSVSKAIPALMRHQKVIKKASKNSILVNENPLASLRSQVMSQEFGSKEIGIILSLVVNIAEKSGIDAEEALSENTKQFIENIGE